MFSENIARAKRFNAARLDWLGSGGVPVTQEQAQSRADTCIKCPKNKSMGVYEGLTTAAARLVKMQLEAKSQMKLRVSNEELLHICSACGCVLELKVHAPISVIQATTETDKLHIDCWILRELGIT